MIVEHRLVGSRACPLMALVKHMQTDMMPPGGEYCLGQSCMMWRWLDWDKKESTDYGYCGLGGIPVSPKKEP